MNNTKTQVNEFTQVENDLITKCWDEPDVYAININPNTKEVNIISLHENKKIWFLGYCNNLTEKLIRQSDITPTFKII